MVVISKDHQLKRAKARYEMARIDHLNDPENIDKELAFKEQRARYFSMCHSVFPRDMQCDQCDTTDNVKCYLYCKAKVCCCHYCHEHMPSSQPYCHCPAIQCSDDECDEDIESESGETNLLESIADRLQTQTSEEEEE